MMMAEANSSKNDENSEISHKGKWIKSYTAAFKINGIKYAEANGNRPAERCFAVNEKLDRE